MVKLLETKVMSPEEGDVPGPAQVVALLIRCDNQFWFPTEGPAGPAPFMRQLDTANPLPSTMGSEGLMLVVRSVAETIGLQPSDILAYEILVPADTLRPFKDVTIHSVILDVSPERFERLLRQQRGGQVLSANWIMQRLSENCFFRPISESYRVAAAVPA